MYLKKDNQYLTGILCALLTSFFWGLLPALLELALQIFSAGTIVWFRFTFAFFILLIILQWKQREPLIILQHPPASGILAAGALAVNYFYFLMGVRHTGPINASILMQLAPVGVVGIGIAIFKERLHRNQTVGLFIAIAGFFLFYLDKIQYTSDFELNSIGNHYIFYAVVAWILFASILKKLTGNYPTQNLNLLMYGVAALVLIGGVQWSEFIDIEFKDWVLLIFLGLNTLIAYGALSEAIRLIPLSLAIVITTTNPLFTLLTVFLVNVFRPSWLQQDSTGMTGYLGALILVTGVALVVYRPESRFHRNDN